MSIDWSFPKKFLGSVLDLLGVLDEFICPRSESESLMKTQSLTVTQAVWRK